MSRLYDDPADFADRMVDGFLAANGRWVRRAPGGVVRSRPLGPGQVALVTGGGSGHYPAFGGLVGHGLAAGAALGNLFASPSWQQARGVARAAQAGAGVLFCYGNYAGDVLNFDRAQEELLAEGIDTRTVVVTDDVSSAPVDQRDRRRGIAGDLVVLKAAGAAAQAGAPLDEVERVARWANERTRSFGVAFSGCSLPGAAEPLFTVPEGRMAVGMGIHGEPGIDETDVPSAAGLARLFVDRLLDPAELPAGVVPDGARVTVILNGLGSVKYEELFVVYATVHDLLRERGVQVMAPECGELVTSFDMAGISLTVCWLDEELERLWQAPADAPAYAKSPLAGPGAVPEPDDAVGSVGAGGPDDGEGAGPPVPVASAESRRSAVRVARALAAVADRIDRAADELGRIDAVAGDGDHGIGMQRGSRAAARCAADLVGQGAGAGTLLGRAADAWSDRAGGTSGALWGGALGALGRVVGDQRVPDAGTVVRGVQAARDQVLRHGAVVGDKTMVDALVPFTDTLAREVAQGEPIDLAWWRAARAAVDAAATTADLRPRVGRARPHAERSLGTPDAGAVSLGMVVTTVAGVLVVGADAEPGAGEPW